MSEGMISYTVNLFLVKFSVCVSNGKYLYVKVPLCKRRNTYFKENVFLSKKNFQLYKYQKNCYNFI